MNLFSIEWREKNPETIEKNKGKNMNMFVQEIKVLSLSIYNNGCGWNYCGQILNIKKKLTSGIVAGG